MTKQRTLELARWCRAAGPIVMTCEELGLIDKLARALGRGSNGNFPWRELGDAFGAMAEAEES